MNVWAQQPSTLLHIVQKKDKSLWRICQRYQVSVDAVKQLNQLSSDYIHWGDSLQIPSDHFTIHTVTKADKSLWRIGQKYNTTAAALRRSNRKKNNIIRAGEQLLIFKPIVLPPPSIKALNNDNWKAIGEPSFDLAANAHKFPFQFSTIFDLSPALLEEFKERSPLDSLELLSLFQARSDDFFYNYNHSKRYYYFSIEQPFLLDLVSLDYYAVSDTNQRSDYHLYDFISILEIDGTNNSAQILPVFIANRSKLTTANITPALTKGSSLSAFPVHPLAYYKESITSKEVSFSKLLAPMVMQYTENKQQLNNGTVMRQDSTILILQLETTDIPSFIDMEVYKDGQRTKQFVRTKRRRELGY